MASKSKKVDQSVLSGIDDLLPEEDQVEAKLQRHREQQRKVERGVLPPGPIEHPEARVMFWEEYRCTCGAEFSGPGYHPHSMLIRVRKGRQDWEYQVPQSWHPEGLPLEVVRQSHTITCCPECIEEADPQPPEDPSITAGSRSDRKPEAMPPMDIPLREAPAADEEEGTE